jgi:hypothetical protein
LSSLPKVAFSGGEAYKMFYDASNFSEGVFIQVPLSELTSMPFLIPSKVFGDSLREI